MAELTQGITLDTSQLREGDVVLTYGMRVLLRGELKTYPSSGPNPCTVYNWAHTLVTNIDEVKAEGFVPLSWLYPEKWGIGKGGGWGIDWSAEPIWTIQGNHLARWFVVERGVATS
ncbi:hypothetical protein ACIRLA_28750 [Streptomyces sp. NPDC102364]|uniref:hypothetical protein n=1 Tax=Streptomyces sp. NPDC102364 TaxID=3366161 RepID=UPI003817C6BD